MANREIVTLGGGCFWCLDAVYRETEGVLSAVAGYMGGTTANPSYKEVCLGTTGHAEVVQITFDPTAISCRDLLEIFFVIHDPTTLNSQGEDCGTQYRSVIFYYSPEQRATAEGIIGDLTRENAYGRPVVTAIEAASTFYSAEEYHQDYFAVNPNQPYCVAVVAPKVEKFRAKFAARRAAR